ncbi:MAG TPA: glycosyltransferase family 39 protein, partial [Polyangiaceae bacterium]|nr:glycosyltransferase family 39 protein [Polyangiaceae bacterium]
MSTRLRQWLLANWPDLLIVSTLVALFCFVHRRLEAVEIGGDAIIKWQFVRQWSYANDLAHGKWDHHKARMGVNAITWIVQKLFGHGWRAYYVGPFFMAALQLPFVYLLGKRLSGRWVGVLAAFFVIYLGAVHRSASQLLPDGYVGTYAIVATYLFARFVEAEPGRGLGFLIATSIVGFAGYLAKETFCFFYPAFIVAVWLGRRRVLDVLLTCGIWLAGLGLETLAYRFFTDYSSRLAIIKGTHLAGAAEEETPTIGLEGLRGLFGRLDLDWDCLLGVGLLGAIWLLFFNRKSTTQGRAIALLGLSHVAALSVTSQIWQNPRPRYMDPATPFAALCAAVVFGVLLLPLYEQLERWPLVAKFGPAARPALASSWLVLIVGVAAVVTYRRQLEDPPFDGIAQGAKIAGLINAAYDRNLPIACDPRGAKVLM